MMMTFYNTALNVALGFGWENYDMGGNGYMIRRKDRWLITWLRYHPTHSYTELGSSTGDRPHSYTSELGSFTGGLPHSYT
jgi:hypothetical protein